MEIQEPLRNVNLDQMSMNLERPIPTAQVPDDISADVTWNLESPNPADISNRLEFKVFPDKGEPCELPNCKRPKPTRKRNLKFVQCTNEDCKTWCHYDCANIPFKTTFTRDQVYLCLYVSLMNLLTEIVVVISLLTENMIKHTLRTL